MKRTLWLCLWVLAPIVFTLVFTFSFPYPNQAMWAWTWAMLGLGLIAFGPRFLRERAFVEMEALIALYLLGFAVVSLWEIYPGTTMLALKFELIHPATAAVGYLLGRTFRPQRILDTYVWGGTAVALFTLGELALVELTRYGIGPRLMLQIPAMLLTGRYPLASFALIVMAASRHKTPLLGALAGASFTLVAGSRRLPRWGRRLHPFLKPIALGIAVLTGLATLQVLTPGLAVTGERFVDEPEDPARSYQFERALELLPVYFPQGMGYMNFMIFSGVEDGVSGPTLKQQDYPGIMLHCSYLTWALEGGCLVSGVVAVLFWRAGRRIRRLLQAPDPRLGILLAGNALSLLVLASAHQAHMTPEFWGTLGVIYGCAGPGTRDIHRIQAAPFITRL
jgi:hypothetical protein